jgi:hypothetical protein
MRSVAAAVLAAYAARTLVKRTLVWITAKDRTTGAAESIGFWSDIGNVSIQVKAGLSLAVVSRDYIGTGGLIAVGKIPLTSDISVRQVRLVCSQIDEAIALAVRGYDAHNAPIEIHEAMLDPATRNLVAPAEPLFVGYIDTLSITTPAENEEGSIEIECVSQSRDLTRGNAAVRSDVDQRLRSATDNFFADTGAVGEREITWGRESRKQNRGKGRFDQGRGK